jgi:hypothetical protein
MGLDRVKRSPCGFCFVQYDHSADATAAINFIGYVLPVLLVLHHNSTINALYKSTGKCCAVLV